MQGGMKLLFYPEPLSALDLFSLEKTPERPRYRLPAPKGGWAFLKSGTVVIKLGIMF